MRRPADKAREGGIPSVFRPKRNDERLAEARFRRDASPVERRVGFATGCSRSRASGAGRPVRPDRWSRGPWRRGGPPRRLSGPRLGDCASRGPRRGERESREPRPGGRPSRGPRREGAPSRGPRRERAASPGPRRPPRGDAPSATTSIGMPMSSDARRTFWPRLPRVRGSSASETVTSSPPSSRSLREPPSRDSSSTLRMSSTSAGRSAFRANLSTCSFHRTTSTRSPRSSRLTARMREPPGPRHAATASTSGAALDTATLARSPG